MKPNFFKYQDFFQQALTVLKETGRYRTFLDLNRCCGDFPYGFYPCGDTTHKVTIWCGNDYLGMGQNPKVLSAMHDALNEVGAGAGGTRNISGTSHFHSHLERELADLHHQEAALVFTSGYVANETTLQTLGTLLPNCIIFSDAKNHASMIQGIRNSRAEKHIFQHNDPADLRRVLSLSDPSRPKLIAIESIYSMDGDIAPLKEFCDLAEEFNALLFLDEVHGVGMYGSQGGGIAQMDGLSSRIDLVQGTLGKAFGLIGGYVAGKSHLIDYIRSFAAGFIFTTSLPPTVVAGALASVKHLRTSSMERQQHQATVSYLKEKLDEVGISYLKSPSHILPVIIGEAGRCKKVAETLLKHYQIYAQPINYPTVPVGTERLRLTPSALHTQKMVDDLVEALRDVLGKHRLKHVA